MLTLTHNMCGYTYVGHGTVWTWNMWFKNKCIIFSENENFKALKFL